MEEVWKPVSVYDSRHPDWTPRYLVSNLGRIKIAAYEDYRKGHHEERMMKPQGGRVILSGAKEGKKSFLVSFLVAKEFVLNPEGYLYVRHKDGDKYNNRFDNLEWSNIKEGYDRKPKDVEAGSKAVRQYDLDGTFIAEFKSVSEASKQLNINENGISQCCRRLPHHLTAGGYCWRYSSDDNTVVQPTKRGGATAKRAVRQYTKDGVLVQEYPSVCIAADEACVHRVNIARCCDRQPRYRSAGGFLWRYADDDEFAEKSVQASENQA